MYENIISKLNKSKSTVKTEENIHNIIVVIPGADSFAVDFKFFFQDDLQNYTLTFF